VDATSTAGSDGGATRFDRPRPIDPWRPDPQIRFVHGATMQCGDRSIGQSPPRRWIASSISFSCTRALRPHGHIHTLLSSLRSVIRVSGHIYMYTWSMCARGRLNSSVRGDDDLTFGRPPYVALSRRPPTARLGRSRFFSSEQRHGRCCLQGLQSPYLS
jgi:hypothetical protein